MAQNACYSHTKIPGFHIKKIQGGKRYWPQRQLSCDARLAYEKELALLENDIHGFTNECGPVTLETPDTFSPFNRLPLELQTKIWEFASSERRIVEIHSDHLIVDYVVPTPDQLSLEMRKRITHLRSHTPPPPILSVCHEARNVARRMYRNSDLANPFVPDSVYFDVEKDTLYLEDNSFITFIGEPNGFYRYTPFAMPLSASLENHLQAYRADIKTGREYPTAFPRSPAGRAMLQIRSLAVSITSLIGLGCVTLSDARYEYQSTSPRFLAKLFHFSLLEELVLVLDKSCRSLVHHKGLDQWNMIKENNLVEEIRLDLMSDMEIRFAMKEQNLRDSFKSRYSRMGKPMPIVRIDLTADTSRL